jgi:hypothetical protein
MFIYIYRAYKHYKVKCLSTHLNLLCISYSSHRQLTCTTLVLCSNIHCTQFFYHTLIFHMYFILCMHHVNFNIFHSAQISVHTIEYTIAKQLILILMRVLTKLLCVKQYLCTPCAHYYVCVHHTRINSTGASACNDLMRGATIYCAYWHANIFLRGAKIYRVRQYANLFHGYFVTSFLFIFGHLEVTLL